MTAERRTEPHAFKDEWSFQRSMSRGNPMAGKPIGPDQPCFTCGVLYADHAEVTEGEDALPVPPYHDDRGDLQEAWMRGYRAVLADSESPPASPTDDEARRRRWHSMDSDHDQPFESCASLVCQGKMPVPR